jgi:hypothetical protein
MKKTIINFLAFAVIAVALFAFNQIRVGGIQGKVTPAEGVKEVVAVLGNDTLRSQLTNGSFVFSNVKRGVYTLIINANPPYKTAFIQKVAVTDSATTDVGGVKLLQ